jgi:hypothetical protein
MKDFSKLCTPAKIYFGIAVIATLFDLLNGVSFMFAFWKMVFAFVWTFILGGLCDKGYKSISWFLVLLPYILMFLASLNIYHVTEEQRQFMRSIQLQGAYGQEAFKGGIKKASENKVQVQKKGILMAKQLKIKDEISELESKLAVANSELNNAKTNVKTLEDNIKIKQQELEQVNLELQAMK